jgi:very-short-patch-repair endonuclease
MLGGFKFRRQHAIGRYVADFYVAECKLIIELDGESHEDRQEYDEKRSNDLAETGLHVIRFSNVDVFENLEGVLLNIMDECEARSAGPSPQPSPLSTGERE